MKLRLALALVLAALLVGLASGAYLGARIAIGRAWRGLGTIFSAPAASTGAEVQIAPATTTEGRTIPWYGAR